MLVVLETILKYLGLKFVDNAISAIVNRPLAELIWGPKDPDNPTPDDGNGSTDGGTVTPTLPVTVRIRLFSTNSVFRKYLDELVLSIHTRRKNIMLSKDDILYSVAFSFKNIVLNNLIWDLIQSNDIVATEVSNAAPTTGFSENACNRIISLCSGIFQAHLAGNVADLIKQVSIVGLPHRVVICIDEAFRSGTYGLGDHVVSIPPISEHVVYEKGKQVDVFGMQLVYGKLAVIKYKDPDSQVYTYALAYPKSQEFNANDLGDWTNDPSGIYEGLVERMGPYGETDLVIKELPFHLVELALRKYY